MQTASILRDYVVKFSITETIAVPSTAWVKKIGVVVKGGNSDEEGIYECLNRSAVSAYTSLTTLSKLFDGGQTSIFIIRVKALDKIKDLYRSGLFWTMIFSEDWTDAEVLNAFEQAGFGEFDGILARMFVLSETNQNAYMDLIKTKQNFCCFATKNATNTNYGNIYYAFGNLLAQDDLDNRQYESMPVDDGILELGLAENLFEKRVSFVTTDSDYGTRLSFFVIQDNPIISPYIDKLLKLDIQAGLVAATNLYKPNKTISAVKKVEDYIKANIIETYINPDVIPSITFKLSLSEDAWFAKGIVQYPPLEAIWRYKINITKLSS